MTDVNSIISLQPQAASADPSRTPAFRRRQRVRVLHGAGSEPATILRADKDAGWWSVVFSDGNKLCVHGSGIEAV